MLIRVNRQDFDFLFGQQLAKVEAQRECPKLLKCTVMYINKATSKGEVFRIQQQLNIRQPDMLFLTFHKEKSSPSVRFLYQQVSFFMIDCGSAKYVHPFHAEKVPYFQAITNFVTVKGRQNSLILASLGLNFLFQRQRIKICPNCLILADHQIGREGRVLNCLI